MIYFLTCVPIKDELSFILLPYFLLFLSGSKISVFDRSLLLFRIFLRPSIFPLTPSCVQFFSPYIHIIVSLHENPAYLCLRSNSGSFWILPCWKISFCLALCSSARFLASSASFCLFASAIFAFSAFEINFGFESSSSFAFLASIISSKERGVAF